MFLKKKIYHPVKNRFARSYARVLRRKGCEFIGITGSAGKTTCKDMLASVLSQKYKTMQSRANIDPVFNIPDTILRTRLGTEKLILEMGIEYPREMGFYLWLVKPTIGICTTIYWTHTQFFGDIEGVCKEKSKLIAALPKNGFAVLNYDDLYVRRMADLTSAKVVWFGLSNKADVRADKIQITKDLRTEFRLAINQQKIQVSLPVLGSHFVPLALSSAAVGKVCGLEMAEIKNGLETFVPPPHRMLPIKHRSGALIVDDTYNANPLAAVEAIKTVSLIGKHEHKILVLGEMKELGIYEEKGHREVGTFARMAGIDMILGLGDLTRYTLDEFQKGKRSSKKTFFAEDKDALIKRLKKIIRRKDVVLIKGSRSMRMEEVVESL
ncbi:UDP-N-acetylmuramoyl-tripeptide--D-alanyl-D-alanine ligase [Candidatus Woesebacteria bacterium]|nr:UDP-N-acetylmuramoyl-tripeptide--D-alanyl-D-alanine ligase [Candidatus Woesebacteria bacterium]